MLALKSEQSKTQKCNWNQFNSIIEIIFFQNYWFHLLQQGLIGTPQLVKEDSISENFPSDPCIRKLVGR